jgi:hypothetical protein
MGGIRAAIRFLDSLLGFVEKLDRARSVWLF